MDLLIYWFLLGYNMGSKKSGGIILDILWIFHGYLWWISIWVNHPKMDQNGLFRQIGVWCCANVQPSSGRSSSRSLPARTTRMRMMVTVRLRDEAGDGAVSELLGGFLM